MPPEPAEPPVNILMVDDTPNNLLVLEATLEGLGQRLIRAGSGREALRRLLDGDFALILMDVQMPGMDGFETADLIRQRDRTRHTPIIFLTAFEHTEAHLFKAYSVGAVDFLFKPLVPEVLRSKVRVFVELHQATEKVRRQAEQLLEKERRELERQLAEERMRATLRLAQQVQQKFFPEAPPACPGLEFGGASRPADETGGDYYDYIPLPDGGMAVAIGDVCGHGLGPALLMATTRAYLRALSLTNPRVGDILLLANRALAADTDDGRFVTLFLARIDPATRVLVYSNAGHPPGFVLGADGEVRAVLGSTGLPLGLYEDVAYPEAEAVALEPGDVLLLLTDGVLEAMGRDGIPFGVERAINVVLAHRQEPPDRIVEALHAAVLAFAETDKHPDDVTSVVVKVGPLPLPGQVDDR